LKSVVLFLRQRYGLLAKWIVGEFPPSLD